MRRHTKALALCVSAYARLASLTGEARFRELAVALADELAVRGTQNQSKAAWAYDFDVQTRWGYYRAGEPNAVVTSFAIHALLDVGGLADIDGRYTDIAHSAAKHAVDSWLIENDGRRFFGYYSGSRTVIHNANMLVAGALARCGSIDRGTLAVVRDAVDFTLGCQQSSGAWAYGEGAAGLEWIDGYHTAYILISLAHALDREPSAARRDSSKAGNELLRRPLV